MKYPSLQPIVQTLSYLKSLLQVTSVDNSLWLILVQDFPGKLALNFVNTGFTCLIQIVSTTIWPDPVLSSRLRVLQFPKALYFRGQPRPTVIII